MSHKVEVALFAAVLLLAGGLRLGWPEITEFKRDEAGLYALALDLAEFKALPLRGIGSSVGLPNAPMSVYLFALPLFVWKSPLAATLFVGALNTASVALLYVMTRRYWGWRAGLFAALLYATAPWAVIYSRKVWAQDLLPLFVTGYIFSALLSFVEGRRRWLIAHLALLALVIQIHPSTLALVPVTALVLLIFRRTVDWRMAGWGLLAALATAIPFVAYFAGQARDGLSLQPLSNLLSRPATISADSLWLATLVSLGLEAHSLAGAQVFRDFLATVPNFDPLLYVGGALCLGGAVLAAWRWLRGRSTAETLDRPGAGLVIILWLSLPILFFVRHSTPVFPHYFILLFPAPYLLAGLFLDAALSRFQPAWVQVAGWALPVIIAASQAWLVLALLSFVGAWATPGAFGTPLGMILRIAEQARSAPDVVVVADGVDPHLDDVPAVFDVLLRGVPHRFVDGRTTAVLPAGDSTVILWPGAALHPGEALYHQWAGDAWSMTVPLRVGEGEVKIARAGGVEIQAPRPREASALLTNGAEMLGSGGEVGAEGAGRWQLWWRAPQGGEGEGATIFAHLLDSDGQRIAQADVPTYPAAGWRTGDLVVSFFPLEGVGATVRAGMYGSLTLAPIAVLDAAGNPAGPWLEFPIDGDR